MRKQPWTTVVRSIAAISVSFYGYALLKLWISLRGIPAFGEFEGFGPSPSGLVHAAIAFAIALLSIKLQDSVLNRIILPTGFACQIACVGAAALSMIYPEQLGFLMALFPSLGAVGTVLCSSLWVSLYARLNPVRATFLNGASIIIAQALFFMSEQSHIERTLVLLAALPFLSLACARVALRNENRHGATPISTNAHPFPVRIVVFVAVCSFAYRVSIGDGHAPGERYAALVPALIALAALLVQPKRFSAVTLVRLVLPLILIGFLLVALTPSIGSQLATLILQAGYGAMSMLVVLLVCVIAYGTGSSAYWLFGILGGVQFLAIGLGSFARNWMLGSLPVDAWWMVDTAIVTSVVLASLAMASERNMFSLFGNSSTAVFRSSASSSLAQDENEPENAPPEESSLVKSDRKPHSSNDPDRTPAASILELGSGITDRIRILAASHGLTDREIEVVLLAVQGKSNNQIGQDMFISLGTVKAHLNHIYQKLGVHSRKEMFDLLGVRRND